MTTVNEKLKSFADDIIKRVEEDSKKRMDQAYEENAAYLDRVRSEAEKEADSILKAMEKRAQEEKNQIISRAKIEMEHYILQKKNELYKKAIEDIMALAYEFKLTPDYAHFLEKCVSSGISRLNEKTFRVLLTREDVKKYGNAVRAHLKAINDAAINGNVEGIDEEIIGGCILENGERTRRIDCSLITMINDSIDMIGNMLLEKL